MRTFASTTRTADNQVAHHFARSLSATDSESHIFSPGVPIQRKASCACGGGCSGCQAKDSGLKVSQPSDPAEIEADQMADKVMRMPDNQSLPLINHQSPSDGIHRKCEECENEEEEPIHRKAENAGNSQTYSTTGMHPGSTVSSGAQALDSQTRAFFEPRFGRDLADVRIYSGSEAAQSARMFKALAYTVGKNIVFGENQYNPQSETGKSLLAHDRTRCRTPTS